MFTQSGDDTVKAFCQVSSMKKGMGWESPAVRLSVCASKFLYPLAKAGHWETEKAGYKNEDSLKPYDASHKTCFDVIFLIEKDDVFGCL